MRFPGERQNRLAWTAGRPDQRKMRDHEAVRRRPPASFVSKSRETLASGCCLRIASKRLFYQTKLPKRPYLNTLIYPQGIVSIEFFSDNERHPEVRGRDFKPVVTTPIPDDMSRLTPDRDMTTPFVLMTNPGVALEAARRLESSHLPRRASLLDARKSSPVDSELAKYDEEVERGATS